MADMPRPSPPGEEGIPAAIRRGLLCEVIAGIVSVLDIVVRRRDTESRSESDGGRPRLVGRVPVAGVAAEAILPRDPSSPIAMLRLVKVPACLPRLLGLPILFPVSQPVDAEGARVDAHTGVIRAYLAIQVTRGLGLAPLGVPA